MNSHPSIRRLPQYLCQATLPHDNYIPNLGDRMVTRPSEQGWSGPSCGGLYDRRPHPGRGETLRRACENARAHILGTCPPASSIGAPLWSPLLRHPYSFALRLDFKHGAKKSTLRKIHFVVSRRRPNFMLLWSLLPLACVLAGVLPWCCV